MSMKTTYSFQFTHHGNAVINDYNFVVYLAYSPAVYDVIYEFNAEEALKHYKAVEGATRKQQQVYLHNIIVNKNLQNIKQELIVKYT
jgi:hypothetical protein